MVRRPIGLPQEQTAGEKRMLQSSATGTAVRYPKLAARYSKLACRYPRLALGIALSALLASCDDGYGGNCCVNGTPVGISAGVVSADFNGDGVADVVAASSVHPEAAASSANLKAYLSTAAGAFSAPTIIAAGYDPLYLATPAINGHGL